MMASVGILLSAEKRLVTRSEPLQMVDSRKSESSKTDIDAVRFLVAAERDGIVLQHCAPFIREWMARESGAS